MTNAAAAAAAPAGDAEDGRVLVQLLTYNTALQGRHGLPQSLTDWLAPSLAVSSFLSRQTSADIVAVGFQELLPLHQGLAGLAGPIMRERATHLRAELEAAAGGKESFTLVAQAVNGGIALLVFARDAVSRRIAAVETAWSGAGPGGMGNKGGVAVRFALLPTTGAGPGETYTFVNAHLAAHENKLARRRADWARLVRTLAFAPGRSSSLYDTAHLFVFGDLNFRVAPPPGTPLPAWSAAALETQAGRAALAAHDQLARERARGTVFRGLREGDFSAFAPTYKRVMGDVAAYNTSRTPSWTDRVMYTSYHDDPAAPNDSAITPLLYTSVPAYTTSDHKPVVALLLVPAPAPSSDAGPKKLRLPPGYAPAPAPRWAGWAKRWAGRALDRVVGLLWCAVVLLGAGSAARGAGGFVLAASAWAWAWRAGGAGALEV